MQQMRDDGIRRALAFITSPYSSYSSCRQYLEDIARARDAVGPGAPEVQRLRHYFDHPGFVEPLSRNVAQPSPPLAPVSGGDGRRRTGAALQRAQHPHRDGAGE